MATKKTVQGRDIPLRHRLDSESPNWATMYATILEEFCEAMQTGVTFKNNIDMTTGNPVISGTLRVNGGSISAYGASGADAAVYLMADAATHAGDCWRIRVANAAGAVGTMYIECNSGGYTSYLDIDPLAAHIKSILLIRSDQGFNVNGATGESGSFKDGLGNDVTVTGGIITNFGV